jgi:hypothetical protein
LGYAFRNHNVRQAVHRMVERNMLICKRDTTGTEKYYLSKLPLEIAGRSPEDNPDIERTNPTYAESIEIRKKAGLTLINSRKQQKTPPAQPANITPLTLADGVVNAQKEDAKRKLDFKRHSKKRPKTTAATASKAQTEVTANSSDSPKSDEDLSQSSSSDSSDSEDTDPGETPDSDSDDTPKKNNDTGFMHEDAFDQILPAAKNKGTDFNNVRFV